MLLRREKLHFLTLVYRTPRPRCRVFRYFQFCENKKNSSQVIIGRERFHELATKKKSPFAKCHAENKGKFNKNLIAFVYRTRDRTRKGKKTRTMWT